jgi:2-polyprenyl-3-methyl-5-hydroxy-6-metoxy-1,4-benzoquinol methylase
VKPLEILNSLSKERIIIAKHILEHKFSANKLEILEAGCGQYWELKAELSDISYELTGIDMDELALKERIKNHNDLKKIIVGDLTTWDMKGDKFDIIYNSFVLEHIQDADRVLDNFFRWLKPGGLIIVRIPDFNSVYGFITRITPLWFHVLYKKYLLGWVDSGKPGYGPYSTYYSQILSREGIHAYAKRNGLRVKAEYGHGFYLEDHGFFINRCVHLFGTLSFGKLSSNHNNLTYILAK